MDLSEITFDWSDCLSDSCKDKFEEYGFVVAQVLTPKECDVINAEIDDLISSGAYKENTSIYKYSPSPRIVESWKFSSAAKDLALNKNVHKLLQHLYSKEPLPFSTINFTSGSNQPLHSDYVHFGSKPEGYLCGVWVALEDIGTGVGELQVVPKSHKWDYFRFSEHGLKKPTKPSEIKSNYGFYEKWVKEKLIADGQESIGLPIKAGQAIIWSANLLHGGSPIIKQESSRKSQVIHYHFHGCELFYNPNFSFFDGDADIANRSISPIN